jgi:glycine cleavage system transcriptional repressor
MNNWYMLTLVGEDHQGIVARVTTALFEKGLSLGETSMIRLGGNFTIMMMVNSPDDVSVENIDQALEPVVESMDLCMHLDPIEGHLHKHVVPNITVRVNGADQAGIVSSVTTALSEAGFNILDLASDVAGMNDDPVYIMMIEGYSDKSYEELQEAVDKVILPGVDVTVSPVEMMVG